MFQRKYNHKRYKVISKDGFGIELKIPRYQKTTIWIGYKDKAIEGCLNPVGSKNFYKTIDNTVVIEGYLAEPIEEPRIEVRVRGIVTMTKDHIEAIQKEIKELLEI